MNSLSKTKFSDGMTNLGVAFLRSYLLSPLLLILLGGEACNILEFLAEIGKLP